MEMQDVPLSIRVVLLILLCGVLILPFVLLLLDHPSQQVEFVGSSDSLEAHIWSNPLDKLSGCLLEVEAKNVIFKPSSFLKVGNRWSKSEASRPGRVPLLLKIQTTPGTVKQLGSDSLSAQEVVLTSSAPILSRLEPQGSISLMLHRGLDYMSLNYAVEHPSDRDRTVHIGPSEQLNQTFSISVNGREPIEGLLASVFAEDATTLTIALEVDEESTFTHPDTARWAGLWIYLTSQRFAYYSSHETDSGGRFHFYLPSGYLTIGNDSQPMHSRYLTAYFLDNVKFILSEDEVGVGGLAETIASGASIQVLPSGWKNLPDPLKAVAPIVALGLLTAACKWLGLLGTLKWPWKT